MCWSSKTVQMMKCLWGSKPLPFWSCQFKFLQVWQPPSLYFDQWKAWQNIKSSHTHTASTSTLNTAVELEISSNLYKLTCNTTPWRGHFHIFRQNRCAWHDVITCPREGIPPRLAPVKNHVTDCAHAEDKNTGTSLNSTNLQAHRFGLPVYLFTGILLPRDPATHSILVV